MRNSCKREKNVESICVFLQRVTIVFAFIMAQHFFAHKMCCFGLTSEERNELARKFKYYHDSVRPTERFNLVQTINGTYFGLNAELEILQTRSDIDDDRKFYIEMVLIVHYNDDRLILRELPDVIHVSSEFKPWLPSIELVDGFGSGGSRTMSSSSSFFTDQSTHLDPKNGHVTVFHRISGSVNCLSEVWKYPFDKFICEIEFLTEQNERLFLRITRDLRINTQRFRVKYSTEEWPNLVIRFEFSRQWIFSIVDVYLPSVLIFSIALFAQWKRRKLQVFVGLGSIICIILIQNAQRNGSNPYGNRLHRHHTQNNSAITMQDIWLSGLLIHLICILTIDLLLPSRRIVYSVNPATGRLKAKSVKKKSYSTQPLYFSKKRTALPYISTKRHFNATSMQSTRMPPTLRPSSCYNENNFEARNKKSQLKRLKSDNVCADPQHIQEAETDKQSRFRANHDQNRLQLYLQNNNPLYYDNTQLSNAMSKSIYRSINDDSNVETRNHEIWKKYNSGSTSSNEDCDKKSNQQQSPYSDNLNSGETQNLLNNNRDTVWYSSKKEHSTKIPSFTYTSTPETYYKHVEVERSIPSSTIRLVNRNNSFVTVQSLMNTASPYEVVQPTELGTSCYSSSSNGVKPPKIIQAMRETIDQQQTWQQDQKFYGNATKATPNLAPKLVPNYIPPRKIPIKNSGASSYLNPVYPKNSGGVISTFLKYFPFYASSIDENNRIDDEDNEDEVDDEDESSDSEMRRPVGRVTIGQKKSIALCAVFVCFIAFVCFYVILAIYAIFT